MRNLMRSAEALQDAARRYKEQQNWGDYATAQHNLGATCHALAEHRVEPALNLTRSVEVFQEATRRWKEQQNWHGYGQALTNLGVTYEALAKASPEAYEPLDLARAAYKEAVSMARQLRNKEFERLTIDRLKAVLARLFPKA
jgi:hypothetical protein